MIGFVSTRTLTPTVSHRGATPSSRWQVTESFPDQRPFPEPESYTRLTLSPAAEGLGAASLVRLRRTVLSDSNRTRSGTDQPLELT